ncbi:hypothetical protein QQX98_007481 [Neonectria punicea]|uniref:Uncharacterized protein n=1 Tax=Neonectria punicea TaxID=979145 RepID=A0ABR1GXT2_9HYPO
MADEYHLHPNHRGGTSDLSCDEFSMLAPAVTVIDLTEDPVDDEEEMALWKDATGLASDDAFWPRACRFFCHSPSVIETGEQLPGVAMTPTGYQMLDVYKTLPPFTDQERNGVLNCSKPGVGQTFESVMVSNPYVTDLDIELILAAKPSRLTEASSLISEWEAA